MNQYLIGVSVGLFSLSLFAKPVHLECKVGTGDSESEFSVKIDEDSGKITHSQKGGSAFNTEGFFAVDKITYQKIDLISGLKMIRRYEISRVDLSANTNTEISSIEFPKEVSPTYLSSTGSCKIIKIKERKF